MTSMTYPLSLDSYSCEADLKRLLLDGEKREGIHFEFKSSLSGAVRSKLGKHVAALGKLLARTKDRNYAHARLAQYRQVAERRERCHDRERGDAWSCLHDGRHFYRYSDGGRWSRRCEQRHN